MAMYKTEELIEIDRSRFNSTLIVIQVWRGHWISIQYCRAIWERSVLWKCDTKSLFKRESLLVVSNTLRCYFSTSCRTRYRNSTCANKPLVSWRDCTWCIVKVVHSIVVAQSCLDYGWWWYALTVPVPCNISYHIYCSSSNNRMGSHFDGGVRNILEVLYCIVQYLLLYCVLLLALESMHCPFVL